MHGRLWQPSEGELWPKDLAKPDTGRSCLGTTEGTSDVERAELASGHCHSKILVRLHPEP